MNNTTSMFRKTVFVGITMLLLIGSTSSTLASEPELDVVAVEETLRAWFTTSPFVEMRGVHRESQTTATAYFVIFHKEKQKDARAMILYLIDKGWYVTRIEVGYGVSTTWWDGVFAKVQRKK